MNMTVSNQGNIGQYLRSKEFRYTVAAILIFFAIAMLVGFIWLKIYTHHGQTLKMPDFTGMTYEEALKNADRHKFRMSIQDSLHILGKPGGEIIKQNPTPGSLVKQNRMVYVTITKRSPDKILSGRLPEMYGKNYDRKKKELEEHFEIKSRIEDTRYDPGDPDQVLAVKYKGVTIMDAKGRDNTVQIEKGDYLDFIVSSKSGGKVEVPDLVCKTYEEAQFLLENLGLKVGEVNRENDVDSLGGTYVISQEPPADGSFIDMETGVNITVSLTKPSSCK
jgi:beta-lactam-binding protein with PASTA domain